MDSLVKIEQLASGCICNDGKNAGDTKSEALSNLAAFALVHEQQISGLLMGQANSGYFTLIQSAEFTVSP